MPSTAFSPTPLVLIADDDTAIRQLLALVVKLHLGATPLCVADGDAALAAVTEHGLAIRIAILDHAMPRRSGAEVATELQRQAPTLPVIVCSAFLNAAERAALDDLPMCAIIDKPFAVDALLPLLRSLLVDVKHSALANEA